MPNPQPTDPRETFIAVRDSELQTLLELKPEIRLEPTSSRLLAAADIYADTKAAAKVREAQREWEEEAGKPVEHHRLEGAAWILQELLKRPHEDIDHLMLEDSYKQTLDRLAALPKEKP